MMLFRLKAEATGDRKAEATGGRAAEATGERTAEANCGFRLQPEVIAALLLVLLAVPVRGQDIVDGYASAMVDVLPDVGEMAGRQSVGEFRARLFAERRVDIGEHLRLQLAGFVDALVADRSAIGAAGTTRTAIVRPTDLYAEWQARHFDIRAGASRVVWGRLDEFQPSDVINPIDVTRFFLEGRSEARMAVGLVRGRVFLPAGVTVEGVAVPKFRRGRFDQLDEATSPFNIGVTPAGLQPLLGPVAFESEEPDVSWRHMQGGVRVTGTAGRVDLGASIYRGYEPFASYELRPFPFPTAGLSAGEPGAQADFAPAPPTLVETFPRFTMIAGDFETTRGPWGIRGEAAYFPEDTLQSIEPPAPIPARTLDSGLGVDRRAGNYRLAANVIASWRSASDIAQVAPAERSDVLIVGAVDRSFARETRSVRVLAAYNPDSDSAFVRAIGAISLKDNIWLEMSAGWLNGNDVVGARHASPLQGFSRRDFVYARLKLHF
jgi:hypothetical protein